MVGRIIHWAPRLLCMAFAAFLGVFALDVFQPGVSFLQAVPALLMHLLPTVLVLVLLALSWRRQWLGGLVFIALGVLYVAWASSKPFFGWGPVLAIAGPLVLAGVLFLLDWRHRATPS